MYFGGIHDFLNVIPSDISKKVSKFCGKQHDSTSQHVQLFVDLMDDFEFSHVDIHMILFVCTLKDDAQEWFSFLLACSICSWSELYSAFMMQFGERISVHDAFTKLLQIRI